MEGGDPPSTPSPASVALLPRLCAGVCSLLLFFSRKTPDDDDEVLISAVSQCEAQLNIGVACDANANIVRMFCVI